MSKEHLGIVICGHVDAGKTFDYNTKILLFNGEIKVAGDVKAGDVLMGDDSTSRIVQSTHQVYCGGYKVKYDDEEYYIINDKHILSLFYHSYERGCIANKFYNYGDIVDIPVEDFLNLHDTMKLRLSGFRADTEFDEQDITISPFDMGHNLMEYNHLPHQYKITSRKNRIGLLSGIMDKYGELRITGLDMVNDIKYICHSLGYSCVVRDYNTVSATYVIDMVEIDNTTESKRQHCCYDISIQPVPSQTFYGFEVDGNHRHLLGDFTVAHNSTTTGHLLFELGGISDREMEKLREEAKIMNRESFAFAFFMDRNKDERKRGVTISCTTKEFFTENYHYTIIDAPGHKDFIKNMISGASQADAALLLVPAAGFEETIAKTDRKKGIMEGQTRQHARLLNLLGVEQIIIGINKMDEQTVNYSETRYNEIRDEMRRMLAKAGFKKRLKEIPIIPMSGFQGENLTTVSKKMPWYKGFSIVKKGKTITGHTIVDALTNVIRPPKRRVDKSFRMPLSGIFKIKGVGDVITGRIEQGTLRPGDVISFSPSGASGKVFSIEMHHKSVESASHGDNVGVNVKNLIRTNMPHTGDVMTITSDNVPHQVLSFRAVVNVQDHPGQLKSAGNDGRSGFTPCIHVRTSKAPCRLEKIFWKLGKSTGKQKQENPLFVEKNDSAEVEFVPKLPMFVEPYSTCPGLGRIAVMDSNNLIMLGKIMSVIYKEE